MTASRYSSSTMKQSRNRTSLPPAARYVLLWLRL
jgi:hypothetical protein